MTTKIQTCNCTHYMGGKSGAEFQDRLYGAGNRLHNKTGQNGKNPGWRCTVCGDVKR